MFKPKRRSFKATIIRAILLPAYATGGMYAGMALVPHTAPVGMDTPHIESSVPGEHRLGNMVESGICWTGGEGHDYPSRVWVKVPYGGSGNVKYVLKGQSAVDHILTVGDWDSVAAFCK